jgi:hypothetical protein
MATTQASTVNFISPRGTRLFQHYPWRVLLELVSSRTGLSCQPDLQMSQSASHVVVASDFSQGIRYANRWSIPQFRRTLILLEPPVTAPVMYNPKNLAQFGQLLSPSPLWIEGSTVEYFTWPQNIDGYSAGEVSSSAYEFDATIIAANKVSFMQNSNYGLRRAIIAACDASDVRLAVIGAGWQDPHSKRGVTVLKSLATALRSKARITAIQGMCSIRHRPDHVIGYIPDKNKGFRLAPISIVVENSSDYVSEKVVDAIRAGVVPIYVGPRLSTFGIPDDVALQVEGTPRAVVRALREMSPERLCELRTAGHLWLDSSAAMDHSFDSVLDGLADHIAAFITQDPAIRRCRGD